MFEYVLGYTIRNDISSRMWQLIARGSRQYSYAKFFDGFVPIGPHIVAASGFQFTVHQTRDETERKDRGDH